MDFFTLLFAKIQYPPSDEYLKEVARESRKKVMEDQKRRTGCSDFGNPKITRNPPYLGPPSP